MNYVIMSLEADTNKMIICGSASSVENCYNAIVDHLKDEPNLTADMYHVFDVEGCSEVDWMARGEWKAASWR